MSASKFKLRVETPDPFAVVEIVGADYAIQMKGGSHIDYAAAPGLYIARAKFRDSVSERIVRISDRDERVVFSAPTAALPGAPGAAAEGMLAKKVAESRSKWTADNWVTIAVKGLQSAHSQELDYPAIRVGDFAVCDLHGTEIKSFQAALVEQFLPESAAPGIYPGEVASVELSPGWYALSMPGHGQTRVMLPLYVAPRFSPTIFIQTIEGPDEIGIDFDKLLVSYDPDEQDSANDQLEWRAIEAARRSLELRRNTLTPSLMRVLLDGKAMNPMLGLLALQMLLLPRSGPRKRTRPASQARLFQQVADKVSELLGAPDHPDLVIARAEARRRKKWPIKPARGDGAPLVAPPLLKANWRSMSSMRLRRPELAGKGRFLYDVGRSLLQAGVWVVWKPPIEEGAMAYDWAEFSLPEHREQALALRQPQDYGIEAVPFAATDRSSPTPPSPDRPRLSRKTADDRLADIANLIRDSADLQAALRNEISAVPPRGSVLDRTIAKTALQLASFGEDLDRSVPRGYVSQLARNLSLPRSMVCDSIAKVEKVLQEGGLQDAEVLAIDTQYLLP